LAPGLHAALLTAARAHAVLVGGTDVQGVAVFVVAGRLMLVVVLLAAVIHASAARSLEVVGDLVDERRWRRGRRDAEEQHAEWHADEERHAEERKVKSAHLGGL
jgi:hypothetical protein